jgi:hypothetical protein
MTTSADIDLIERYLAGKLSPSEKMDFEFRLEDDRELARKLRMRQNFPSLFKAEGSDAIEMELNQELTSGGAASAGRKALKWILPALLVMLIAGVTVYFIFAPESISDTRKKPAPVVKERSKTPPEPRKQVATVLTPKDMIRPGTPEPTVTPTVNTVAPENKPVSSGKGPVELLTPANRTEVLRGQEIVFQWKMATDSFTNFYLYSAGHKLAIWRGIPPGIRQIKLDAAKFKPGEFYWYIGNKNYRRTLIIRE